MAGGPVSYLSGCVGELPGPAEEPCFLTLFFIATSFRCSKRAFAREGSELCSGRFKISIFARGWNGFPRFISVCIAVNFSFQRCLAKHRSKRRQGNHSRSSALGFKDAFREGLLPWDLEWLGRIELSLDFIFTFVSYFPVVY